MNIKKLFNKGERGTGKKKVPVKRKSGTHLEYRRVGRKEDKPKSAGFQEILDRAQKFIDEGINIRSVIMKEQGKYVVHIMGRYTEGKGIGSIGSQSLLEIHYKDGAKAEIIKDRINELSEKEIIPKKEILKFSELDKMDFSGLSDMVNESIDRVSSIYEHRPMDADDVLDHIENLIPKDIIKESKISLATEFVNRLFNEYKLKYGDKIRGNKEFTRKIDYHKSIYKSETINIMKFMRGTHKAKVPVKRETGTKYEYRRVGKKSPRTGTGKMDRFPDIIKKVILEQRSQGVSGVKIKEYIESMIIEEPEGTPAQQMKLKLVNNKIIELSKDVMKKGTTQEERNIVREKLNKVKIQESELRRQKAGESKIHIGGEVLNRDLIKEGLINKDGKFTVTPQALTDWARKQGVESKKKRTSAVDAEKVKHEDTKNELDRADKKIVRLEIEAKSKNEVLQLVQQSKQESDKIRQQLGKDNLDLKSKLKSCLGDKK